MIDGGTDERVMRRALAALLVGSALLKLIYVFGLTDYRNYLFSDFGGYWNRAHERLAGAELDYSQWAFWPPLPHVLLSWYLALVRLLGLSAWELEAALVANVAASTASVAFLYGIALEILQRRAWALAVAAAYAFTFPLAYFNAFVMSEHGAVLFMLAALWLTLRYRRTAWALLAAGALLGLASAVRPAFGLFGLPCVLYLAFADRLELRSAVLRAAVFSMGFSAVVGAAIGETYRISGGAVLGLSANGAQNFYFSQCRVSTVRTRYLRGAYSFTAASFSLRPEYGSIDLDVPVHDQAFFAGLGWRCLKEEPRPWSVLAQRAGDLFFGPLLPTSQSARGFVALLPAFRWLFLACALIAPLALAARRAHGVESGAVRMLGGMLAAALLTLGLFGVEHRYLYPLLPLLYVLVACAVLVAIQDPRRMALAGAAWVLALGMLVLGALATQALRWQGLDPAIGSEIRKHASPDVASGTEPVVQKTMVRRLYYPEGDRLWRPQTGEDGTFAIHRTCMEVREPGLYELQVVAGVGFTLRVDGRALISERFARLDGAYKWRLELPAGKHAYEVRMDRPIGVTATWRRVTSHFSDFAPALHMHYVGEPDEDAVFLPPERC